MGLSTDDIIPLSGFRVQRCLPACLSVCLLEVKLKDHHRVGAERIVLETRALSFGAGLMLTYSSIFCSLPLRQAKYYTQETRHRLSPAGIPNLVWLIAVSTNTADSSPEAFKVYCFDLRAPDKR